MKNESKTKAKAPAAKRALKSASTSENPEAKSKKTVKKATGAKLTKARTQGKAAGESAAAKTKVTPVKAAAAAEKRAAKAGKPAKKTTGAKLGKAKTAGAKLGKAKTAGAKVRSKKVAPAEGVAGREHFDEPIVDPIGDTTDGEGRTYTGAESNATAEMQAFRADTADEAMDSPAEAAAEEMDDVAREELETEPREPGKLERLQKILSRAGVASRRHAEEMITEGRVVVNGQVVTQLGSKADPERDHIRVDGKLLKGAERHRYFMLNKPKGYVTTASDPEGRPTVMEFFAKTSERVYPVGRLDYLSEGLLLMTNDGELANLLTKAGSGVEKTYLVKVAGQPSEEELERLRGGVEIERGEEGSGRVRTAPARVRQVREGDNPWYEVVLIEGRNRELRKMFSAVGHFVEKIRRVGYGPLVLDIEPGRSRELAADEVAALRLTAEGKMKPRRMKVARVPPSQQGWQAGKSSWERKNKGTGERGNKGAGGPSGYVKRPGFEGTGFNKRREKPFGVKPALDGRESVAGQSGERGGERGGERKDWKPREKAFGRSNEGKPIRHEERTGFGERTGARPDFRKRQDKPFGARPRFERPEQGRSTGKPGGFGERPKFGGPRPFAGGPRPERQGSKFSGRRPVSSGPRQFGGDRSEPGAKPPFERPALRIERRRFERPERGGEPRGRGEGRSSERTRKPFRAQGERPNFKPGGPPTLRIDSIPGQGFDNAAGKSWTPRPERPRSEGLRRDGGAGRSGGEFRGKSFGGPGGKPGGGRSKPAFGSKSGFSGRPGGFGKSNRPGGFKRPGKPSGAGRGGPRFGGRPGGR